MDREAWLVVAAVATAIVSVARLTRLLTHDDFPPIRWLRLAYITSTELRGGPWRRPWSGLATCPFCMAPWIMLVIGLWGVLAWDSGWPMTAWWLFNGWMAASYAASMVVLRDEPPE